VADAGHWELRSCVIIMTMHNEVEAPVHNRMPVTLAREDEEADLNPDETESAALLPVFRPLPAEALHPQIVL
jgi:putative SOS response-associated peptidase YedK